MTRSVSASGDGKPAMLCSPLSRFVLYAGTIAAVLGVAAGAAQAGGWVWPCSLAEAKLEADYRTADPWALRDAREQLHEDLAAGWPESSSRIRHDRQDVIAAGRNGYVRVAHCRGADRPDAGEYGRFWCSLRLASFASQYEGTKKVTLVVRGRSAYRVLNGWH